jgi:hypothetical protein
MIYYFSVRRMVKRNMVTGTRRFDKPASLLPPLPLSLPACTFAVLDLFVQRGRHGSRA